MKSIIRMLSLLAMVAGCAGCDLRIDLTPFGVEPHAIVEERPTVNLPEEARQENWRGRQGEGSCVWASSISLLRWQGRDKTADWIRQYYGDGEWPSHWARLADQANLRYAMTTSGDVAFLDWALSTRRGAAVTVRGGRHCVNLVHLDDRWACLLDNNRTDKYVWVPRETFLAEWRASHGWAFTMVYAPCPPLPQ